MRFYAAVTFFFFFAFHFLGKKFVPPPPPHLPKPSYATDHQAFFVIHPLDYHILHWDGVIWKDPSYEWVLGYSFL